MATTGVLAVAAVVAFLHLTLPGNDPMLLVVSIASAVVLSDSAVDMSFQLLFAKLNQNPFVRFYLPEHTTWKTAPAIGICWIWKWIKH